MFDPDLMIQVFKVKFIVNQTPKLLLLIRQL